MRDLAPGDICEVVCDSEVYGYTKGDQVRVIAQLGSHEVLVSCITGPHFQTNRSQRIKRYLLLPVSPLRQLAKEAE